MSLGPRGCAAAVDGTFLGSNVGRKTARVSVRRRGIDCQNSMQRAGRRQPGFTLIELLTVVGIVGLLAALLFPALSKAKASGRSTSCRNQLRQMVTALQMYAQDQNNRYPFYLGPPGPSHGDVVGRSGRAAGLVYWSSKLGAYGLLAWTNRAFHCPGYNGLIAGPWSGAGVDRSGGYAYNTYGVTPGNTTRGTFGLGPIQYWETAPEVYVWAVSESQVVAPSEMLAMGDSLMKVGMEGASDVWGCVNMFASVLEIAPHVARHGRRENQAYVDGHVASMDPSDLYNPERTATSWNYDHRPHEELWKE